ncbi:helix-turn-helix domain-containing protein [Lysobacter capsici]|uniref:helix-turn-helix domain-containing protein n=1 Tax=Lysobacter capsici TaxID=435897 RepID=UPI0007166AB1|nr:helix-turn-helix transcriptional regulator [Lysobacter capsici]
MPLIACLPGPRDADEKTVRRCDSEQDAIAVSLALAPCTQAEVARRMGVSRSYISMLKSGERPTMPEAQVAKFCSATGSNLLRQYLNLQTAIRIAQGRVRFSDRIAEIASYSRKAA